MASSIPNHRLLIPVRTHNVNDVLDKFNVLIFLRLNKRLRSFVFVLRQREEMLHNPGSESGMSTFVH